MTPDARKLFRTLTPTALRRVMHPIRLGLIERSVMRALAAPEPVMAPGTLVVSGLLSGAKGVSQGARLSVEGLRKAGLPLIAHDIEPVLKAGPGANAPLPFEGAGGVWFAHINAPEAVLALACLDPGAWRGRYRIGYWAWELPVAPPSWTRAAQAFHEIWAPSAFCADAFRAAGVTVPVRVAPHPVHLLAPPGIPRRDKWGLEGAQIAILAMGELESSLTRKNLSGAASIFRRTFPDAQPGGPVLILKAFSSQAEAAPDVLAELTRGRADIRVITERLPYADVMELIASCDVFLSPHRAEGFGLVIAEAMLAGVPALATGWSGNLEFMQGLEPLLIASAPIAVRDPSGVYRAGKQSWADPDEADAAEKLLALARSPELRQRMAAEGRRRVEALGAAWTGEALHAGALGRWVETGRA